MFLDPGSIPVLVEKLRLEAQKASVFPLDVRVNRRKRREIRLQRVALLSIYQRSQGYPCLKVANQLLSLSLFSPSVRVDYLQACYVL